MTRNVRSMAPFATLLVVLMAGAVMPAGAATLCVNHFGTGGCYSKIGTAILHASPNSTINVAPGIYHEDVVIGMPLSLEGANVEDTVIDATGYSNGIYIDGLDNAGLGDVVVRGFTIRNAKFEGILITNATSVTIANNDVTHNDQGLMISGESISCPNQPAFETSETDDCGEGIHLMGVDHSIVANNTSENNAGGILLTDETAVNQDNLITGNEVRNNPYDCGITLASHPPASGEGEPLGIAHNTISGNESTRNGYLVPGAGAGVGLFSFLPGGTVTGNVVINNRLTNNGLPGVAMHAHSPGENLNDNLITGNEISGNGADTEDAATPGPTGINIYGFSAITGTIISQNVIKDETDDIVISTNALVNAHLNYFTAREVGIDNLGAGTVDATENWWGCTAGPGVGECASVLGSNVLSAPWLTRPFQFGF